MTKTIHMTPRQLATTLLFEAHIHALELAANQLGGFLSLKDEAAVLLEAREVLAKALLAMRREWEGNIVVAAADAVPRLVQP